MRLMKWPLVVLGLLMVAGIVGLGIVLRPVEPAKKLVEVKKVSEQKRVPAIRGRVAAIRKVKEEIKKEMVAMSPAIRALSLNVYWEAALAHEPLEGLQSVAWVTGERARDGLKEFGGTTIEAVVGHRRRVGRRITCEFSWKCMAAAKTVPSKMKLWRASVAVATAQQDGKYTPPTKFRSVRWYLNREVVLKKYPRNLCWFEKRLIEVGKIHPQSRHVAYRRPASAGELRMLATKKPASCMLAAKKKKKTPKE